MVPSPLQTNHGQSLDVAFRCDYGEVRLALEAVTTFLRQQRLTDDEIMGCELALAEGCNNAVRYAGENGSRERIRVRVLCTDSRVTFWVHDHTPGFEWPANISLPEGDSENGRGLFLMTSLMEEVHYFRGRQENILYLVRTRGLPAVSPEGANTPTADELRRKALEDEQIITDMAEELSFCYESLAAIFRHSAEQGNGTTKADFARRLLNDLIQIIVADWYVLRLLPAHGEVLNFLAASEPYFSERPLHFPEAADTARSVEVEAAVTRQNVWFDQHRPLGADDPLAKMKPGATGVVHPIFFGERLMGTLVLGRNLDRTPFTAGQLNVVGTFSDFLAIQFVNAEIQESLIHSRLNEREIEIARAIQQSLIRRELPAATGIELAGHCESARQVGGDFFDVIDCGNDQLLLVVADVMGKGVPAAMFAAILRSLFRALPWGDFRPSQLLNQANRLLYNDLSAVDMFITVQVLHIDATARRVRVANAGHCPALLSGRPGETAQSLAPDGVPLGVLQNAEFSDQEATLSPGARLLAYTDGLVETRNPAGELYGYERLNEWLLESAAKGLAVQQMKERLIGELSRFQETDLIQDDQTFLILAG